MTKKEILALTDAELVQKAKELTGRETEISIVVCGVAIDQWNPVNDIGAAMTYLFESVYGRGGKIRGGAWVLGTVEGGRDVASACLMWNTVSVRKRWVRVNKMTVVRPRGEMAKAITQCWVCAMLGVSDA